MKRGRTDRPLGCLVYIMYLMCHPVAVAPREPKSAGQDGNERPLLAQRAPEIEALMEAS